MIRHNNIDIQALKRVAAAQWVGILSELGGISADLLDGRHHPCPRCGGKDRFRWDREKEFAICNQCFCENNGDGIAALQWLTGKSFSEVVRMVAECLHIGNGYSYGTTKKDSKTLAIDQVGYLTENKDSDNQIRLWCGKKPPITLEAVKAYGGRLCRWFGKACVAFDGRDIGDDKTQRAILLYQSNGEHFQALCKVQNYVKSPVQMPVLWGFSGSRGVHNYKPSKNRMMLSARDSRDFCTRGDFKHARARFLASRSASRY